MSVYPFIEAERAGQHNVAKACELLEVSRSAFYEHAKHLPSFRSLADADLAERIEAIYDQSRGTYGWPRVHAALRREGIHASRKRVARIITGRGEGEAHLAEPQPACTLIELDGAAKLYPHVEDWAPPKPDRCIDRRVEEVPPTPWWRRPGPTNRRATTARWLRSMPSSFEANCMTGPGAFVESDVAHRSVVVHCNQGQERRRGGDEVFR